jgi:hypothetical protein
MRRRVRLDQTRARLARWRAQHAGRGIPVPEALWAEAVEVARAEGVEATARGLRLDRSRLAARMPPAGAAVGGEVGARFVELDAGRLGLSPRTVIRLEGSDGERLEVELGTGVMVDIAALIDAFWRRRR